MRKAKLLVIVGILFLITVSSAFSLRLGMEFGSPSVVFIVRPNPFDFRIGYNFEGILGGSNNAFLFLSGDYRIIQMQLIDFLNVYLSAGAFVQLETGTQEFNFGGRIPVGLNAYLMDGTIELFAEIVPIVTALPAPGFQFMGHGYLGFTIRVPKF